MVNDDFAFERVPDEATVSGLRVALVLIGIIIALPSFITGADLGFALGFQKGAISILVGGLVLSAIAVATGTVGAKARLTTAMITRHTFGSLGGRIVSGVLAVACLGWFGVTAEVFGRSLHQILSNLGWDISSPSVYIVLGGLGMITTTIFGFSALQRLSHVTVPLLALLIGYTAFLTMTSEGAEELFAADFTYHGLGDGVSAIVGTLSVAVTIFPDFCRFSRTSADARFAALLTYAVAMPVVLMLAMLPSIVTQERDIVVIMTTLGLGIPALALVIVKAWATNSGNLYVAALSAANLLASTRQRWIVVAAGILGILLAVGGITERLIPFLVALGVGIPPIAGIYVADFWIRHPAYDRQQSLPPIYAGAFACWAFGISVAVAARADLLTLSGVSAIDSMLAAAASYFVVRRLWPLAEGTRFAFEASQR